MNHNACDRLHKALKNDFPSHISSSGLWEDLKVFMEYKERGIDLLFNALLNCWVMDLEKDLLLVFGKDRNTLMKEHDEQEKCCNDNS